MAADKSNIYNPARQLKDYPDADIYANLPIVFIKFLKAQAFRLIAAI